MTWRQVLGQLVRNFIINTLAVQEAQDIVDNGFNAADLVELNVFLDSTAP